MGVWSDQVRGQLLNRIWISGIIPESNAKRPDSLELESVPQAARKNPVNAPLLEGVPERNTFPKPPPDRGRERVQSPTH
jgi:hypothetical protein